MRKFLQVLAAIQVIGGFIIGLITGSFWGLFIGLTGGIFAAAILIGLDTILENQERILYEIHQLKNKL